MKSVGIDFETYYDKEIGIKTCGLDPYIRHPKAKPYLVSMYSEDEHGKIDFWYIGSLEAAPWEKLNGCRLVAHNARFDETVFLQHQGTLIPNSCKPAEWACTADLSVYLSGPRSLLGACRQLLNLDISKGYRITALGKTWEDFTKDERKEIVDAGGQDARGTFLLWKHFNEHWPKEEQELSRINREISRRGIRVNSKKLNEAVATLENALWKAGQAIPWNWGGKRSKTPLLRKEILMQCRKEGIPCPSSFAQDSTEAMDWEATYSEDHPWINSLKIWRNGNGFLSKLRHLRDRSNEGIYSYTLKYFGAHTGRFSGDGGFNMQNIYRDERYGVNLRHMFIPRAGKKFLIADLRQIEARILLWMAKMDHALELIRSGLSVYEVHAIETMGWDPAKGNLKKEDPEKYSLAKARVLALGYGCGAVRFKDMAYAFCGLKLDTRTCKTTVDDFRAKNPEICRLWQRLQSEMIAACRTKSRTYRMKLPSGRTMEYFKVTAADGLQAQIERGGNHYHYYGGKACENLIQAIGRDILRDGMLACAKLDFCNMVLTVHDEIILEVEEDIPEEQIKQIESAMTESSPWAEGLPLDIDWELTEHYIKG